VNCGSVKKRRRGRIDIADDFLPSPDREVAGGIEF
jgi:hypothetical protein